MLKPEVEMRTKLAAGLLHQDRLVRTEGMAAGHTER